jgi:hypothetical protein
VPATAKGVDQAQPHQPRDSLSVGARRDHVPACQSFQGHPRVGVVVLSLMRWDGIGDASWAALSR